MLSFASVFETKIGVGTGVDAGVETGVETRNITTSDVEHVIEHIPPDVRCFVRPSGTVDILSGHKGTGPYQGYDVIKINYEFNKGAHGRVKIFPILISKYSDSLQSLIQVSVILYGIGS